MATLACCLGPVIYYRPDADRRREGWAILHELAEGILERSGLEHNHTDVQALTLALIVPRADAMLVVRRTGSGAAGWLRRRIRYAPAWAIRWRLAMILADSAAA
jgi:hypothetical protein